MKPKIYIAGPYTNGDVAINVHVAYHAAEDLARRGYVPFLPHASHFWHLFYPHEKGFWMKQDREWLVVCDAVLRLPGYSEGADEEVTLARAQGIQVFETVVDLIAGLRHPDL